MGAEQKAADRVGWGNSGLGNTDGLERAGSVPFCLGKAAAKFSRQEGNAGQTLDLPSAAVNAPHGEAGSRSQGQGMHPGAGFRQNGFTTTMITITTIRMVGISLAMR